MSRLDEIRKRLNEIWFSGRGPAGGDIRPEDREEFIRLLDEEERLLNKSQTTENRGTDGG